LYWLFGHRLIEWAYRSESNALFNRLMPGRASTAVESYLAQADRTMWFATVSLLLLYFVTVVLIKTRLLGNAILVIGSFFVTSFLLFCMFEWFPSLIIPLHLDNIGYYSYKAYFTADDQLIYKQKPLTKTKAYSFRGDHYSPAFGIEVRPVDTDWEYDEDGFRNSGNSSSGDIVVIGDSYIDYGNDESDTFGKRLERQAHLHERNLGTPGYGPFQYLEVLKRYGTKSKPKVALFCFFEGNDLGDIRAYKNWKESGVIDNGTIAMDFSRSFLGRYPMALLAVTRYFRDAISQTVQGTYARLFERAKAPLHPDVAILNLGEHLRVKKILFGRAWAKPVEELEGSSEWSELRRILDEFKRLCIQHQITPLVLFIPTDTHVYAQYSTPESGQNWLRIRDEQIAQQEIIEQATIKLACELNVALIDLCPVFKAAVNEGKLLYDPLDTHWNSEGREVAGRHVAEFLLKAGSMGSRAGS